MIKSSLTQQKGVTLSELMIALGLGLFLIAGAITMFLSSKQTYTSNQTLATLQESGRYALNLLIYDIRNSGYNGSCLTQPINHISADPNAAIWAEGSALRGWNNNTKPTFLDEDIIENSDVLFVQYGNTEGVFPSSLNNSSTSNDLDLGAGTLNQNEGASIIASDGLGCDFFELDGVADTVITKKGTTSWSHDYGKSLQLLSLHRILYYLANDGDVPTLYKALFDDSLDLISNEPMVPNISSLIFNYGILNNAGTVTHYLPADQITNWDNVGTIQITLQVTNSNNLTKNFNSIVSIRNRLQ